MSPVKLRVVNEKSDPPKLIEKVKERQKQRNQLKVGEKAKKSVPAPVEIPPVTPSPSEADLFSPTESMASSVPGIRDTPPPSELLSKAAENTRPSRRQRAQVSYVEPSLRDKMRRPGKGLADAVIIGKPIKDALHDVVKLEDVSMSNWMSGETRRDASEPISPLQSKSLQAEESLPRTVGTNNRGKSTTPLGDMDINDPKSDISRSTIAALMSSQRRLSRVQEGEICRSMEDCGGEDTNKSSPESFERKESKLVKQSRRHSSMSDVRSKKEASSRSKASECKMDSEQLSASRAERIASRRRSMQL